MAPSTPHLSLGFLLLEWLASRLAARPLTSRPSAGTSVGDAQFALVWCLQGAIMARLLSTPGLQLVGARMVQPSAAMVDDYVQVHTQQTDHMNAPWFHGTMNAFLDKELRLVGARA